MDTPANKARRATQCLMNVSLCIGLLGSAGCDAKKSEETNPSASASASASAVAEAPKPKPKPKPKASAKPRPMPPRPVPIGSKRLIQATDPTEKQMMAINYTIAMLAAQPGDPSPQREAISELASKLTKGKYQAYSDKGGRLLVIDTPTCNADVPKKTLSGRSGMTLKQLHELGVNVVKCHSKQWACHQSTRNPKDVLCHAAPKRGAKMRLR